jgi:tetratricopeptide (TPR) repeat protein
VTPEDFERVRTLFLAARKLDAAERAEFLDRTCAAEADVRAEVEALLAQEDDSDHLLRVPSRVPGVRSGLEQVLQANEPEPVPDRIGRYSILGTLGQGGMGVVYLAQQEHPRREVALKVVRPGGMSPTLLRRFEHEASILGQLAHPGIAHIHEAGIADVRIHGGPAVKCPFFALEYVRGATLGEYVERRRPSMRQRLGLLASICDAVHHAHQKGVIHRDLKPANILVDQNDQPKILDFGVARATDADVQITTLQTDVGQLVGTIPYMSPEQVAGDPRELDTRSDVYGLGVLGYQLLTGQLPHDVAGKTIPEAVRVIAQDDPTPLSSVDRVFRGDLDTIFAKALEKDRTRRYQSASDLAADIRRYLSDQPVSARPVTTFYQLRKFARRNRLFVSAVAATFVFLCGALAYVTVERNRARAAEQLAGQRRAEAVAQASKADAIRQFLEDMLASVDPTVARGRDTALLKEVLDDAARRVDDEFAGQPEVRASLHDTIGHTYLMIGLFDEAEEHARQELQLRQEFLGDQHADIARTLVRLATALVEKGDLDEAEGFLRQVLAMRDSLAGPDELAVATALDWSARIAKKRGNLDEAESLLREARVILVRHLADDHDLVMQNTEALGVMLAEQGKPAEAEALFRENLARQRELHQEPHPAIGRGLLNLGVVLRDQAEFEEAITCLEQAVAMRRVVLGRHKDLAVALGQLGALYLQCHELAQAEAAFREALEIDRETLPADHPDVRQRLMQLGNLLLARREFDAAEAPLREALDLERRHGPGSTRLLGDILHRLGHLLRLKGELDESEQLLSEALDVRRRIFSGPHPEVAATLGELGNVLVGLGRYDEAETQLREVLTMTRDAVGDDHPAVATRLNSLADLYYRRGMLAEAEPLYREAVAICRKTFGDQHANVMVGTNNLANVLRERGEYEQAEAMFNQALDLSRTLFGAENAEAASILSNLAALYKATGRLAEAEAAYRESLAMGHKCLGETHPKMAAVKRDLASLLRETGRAAEGEPLLREALAALEERLVPTHLLVHTTRHELGRTLLELGRPEEAEEQLRECLAARRAEYPADHARVVSTELALGECLVGLQRFTEAEPLLRTAYAHRTETADMDDRAALRPLIGLVTTLIALERFDEAEPLALQSYERHLAAYGAAHDQTRRAIRDLLELYERSNMSDKAAEWRTKLDDAGNP